MHAIKQWYKDWFNSPYYHLLYYKRDENEAAAFIDKLINYINPAPGATMLDVACGKGRHSLYLSEKGFDVTGIDLSEESIRAAKELEHDNLNFYQHDMRLPFRINYFDVVFNFFTSFGYFDCQRDNENALHTMASALKHGGTLVLDYLNSEYVKQHLVPHEEKEVDGVHFSISRSFEHNKFLKEISIHDPANSFEAAFTESVSAFSKKDFEEMFARQHLNIKAIFGDYKFHDYSPDSSQRLILIATK